GGQELMMPILQPLELWQQTGRHGAMGKTLFTLTDRRERQLALGPTHEEVITELVKYNVQSYRDLPLLLYQIQTKFRDEPRPRAGLIRAREFVMKDPYSFDVDAEGLDKSFEKMRQAYENICQRCGLPWVMVEADSGAIGGKECHEFTLISESGEDVIVRCPSCGYAANTEKAVSVKEKVEGGQPAAIEQIATPGKATIEEVADFLKVPHKRTLKAVFYIADGDFLFIVIRGDLEVNEVKLKNALHCTDLRMASEAEVKEAGIVAGAASPVGIKGIRIIADDSVTTSTNFIAGANKPATHIKNVNYPRDFKADMVTDIATARAGDTCAKCGSTLASSRCTELGHIFKLGTFYSEKMGARFIDKDGQSKPIIMGCYGIGPSRLLAAVIEQNHDDKGIVWPASVAPYRVHLCPLYREGSKVAEVTEKLYSDLTAAGLEVLLDDREESPGVKFNDADLLGIPVRVTISPRSLEKNSVEVKRRSEKQAQLVALNEAAAKIRDLVG
ncbi:MAG TPA: proline--tRNA ligase, partial [Dehalococcoidales bacterium]|nr:proline--tRNA ligase [Dehalococcoidales bacterium]